MLGEDYVCTLVFNDEICVKNGLSISALIKFSLCFVLFYFIFFFSTITDRFFSWRSSLQYKSKLQHVLFQYDSLHLALFNPGT